MGFSSKVLFRQGESGCHTYRIPVLLTTKQGRLMIPCDHIEKVSEGHFSHIIYSDDHGETWQQGGGPTADGVNECMVAELGDGSLVLNMRNHSETKRIRAASILIWRYCLMVALPAYMSLARPKRMSRFGLIDSQ